MRWRFNNDKKLLIKHNRPLFFETELKQNIYIPLLSTAKIVLRRVKHDANVIAENSLDCILLL